jgi:hypothetical protein
MLSVSQYSFFLSLIVFPLKGSSCQVSISHDFLNLPQIGFAPSLIPLARHFRFIVVGPLSGTLLDYTRMLTMLMRNIAFDISRSASIRFFPILTSSLIASS